MSQVLPIEIHDELYAAIELQALRLGTTPATLAAETLAARFETSSLSLDANPSTPEQTHETSRQRFEDHFGSVNLGAPTNMNNDAIDADLAREYSGEGRE
jgi:hypothetical protein